VRCAIYARYSSDNQHESSIDDQIRNCREMAARKGWVILEEHIYRDDEKTGTTIHGRDGLAQLKEAAKSKPKPFDYVLVDDTSRLGRNKADVFKIVDVLSFHKIWLYFVEDGLDSSEPWFDNAFTGKAQRDQEYSKSLAHKVRRGKRGRFLAGYHPGNTCFGYINVPDEDPTLKGQYGRPGVRGVWQVINPEEARIVVRIFKAYAVGMSMRQIARMLNAEGIPTAMSSRTGRKKYWCQSAIREMLKNRRYIGETTWGRTYQERDPESGKMVTRYVDEADWDRVKKTELQIISDELFERVQQQLKRATRGFGIKQLGGMSRATSGRHYLFSGLLKCGICGGSMIITTTNPSRYGCARHRNSNTCKNRATILVSDIEERLMAALTRNLLSDDLEADIVRALLGEVREANRSAGFRQSTAAQSRVQIEAERKSVDAQIKNVASAIKAMGHSPSLLEELKGLEAQAVRLNDALAALLIPAPKDVTEGEIRAFLKESRQRFTDVLNAEPEIVRNELRRRISSITLTPSVNEHGPVYEVAGDVALFVEPKGVEQSSQPGLDALHYTLPISLKIAACRNHQRRAQAETGSQEIGDEPDAICGEAIEVDILVLFHAVIHRLRQTGALKSERRADGGTHLFLPEFGGLRLAARAA